MVNYLAKMRRKLALGPFFTVFIGADQRNSIQNTIQVSDYHKTKGELNPFRCKRLPRRLVYMVTGVEKKKNVFTVISITIFFRLSLYRLE